MSIYFDNAASTPLRAEVRDYMMELLELSMPNPSSTHAFGRKAKAVLEASRKSIAQQVGFLPGELIFTSGGTEADNSAMVFALRDLGCKRIITSPTEHHAVLHAAESWAQVFGAEVVHLSVDEGGRPDLAQLESLLAAGPTTLVSLMHGNNEIGTLVDLQEIGDLTHQYGGYFHSDTVQTVGHFPLSLGSLPVDFAAASAHKFYGPKGVGFLYVAKHLRVKAYVDGGAQERGHRGGTENIVGVGAMARALELAYAHLEEEKQHILGLKSAFKEGLERIFPRVSFNGLSGDLDQSLYTVLSACIPELAEDSMLLFNLDLQGVAVSGGSACSSGSNQGSHVIRAVRPENTDPVVRFSFGKDNRLEEVQRVLGVLEGLRP